MFDLLNIFFENLLPIFLAAAAGYVLSWKTDLEARHVSKVLFYIFSPALVFTLIQRYITPEIPLLRMAVITIATMLLVALLVFLIGKALGYSREMTMAMVLPAMLLNTGNMGIPVTLFVFGEEGLAYGTVVTIITVIMSYSAGVIVASLGKADIKTSLLSLVKLPMLYGVLLAVVMYFTGWSLPLPVGRAVDLMADAAIPTMLVLLGMQLQKANLRENIRALFISTSARLVAGPLIMLGLSSLAGMTGLVQQVSILQAGMPGAVTATVLATEYDTNPEFVTAAITIATVLSPFTLTPLIWLLTA
ncbi:MAG TPA: AEC family transporter [Chloroflexi bacterium]|nr:AEC family transporter [Chloroflexota bacterium]